MVSLRTLLDCISSLTMATLSISLWLNYYRLRRKSAYIVAQAMKRILLLHHGLLWCLFLLGRFLHDLSGRLPFHIGIDLHQTRCGPRWLILGWNLVFLKLFLGRKERDCREAARGFWHRHDIFDLIWDWLACEVTQELYVVVR